MILFVVVALTLSVESARNWLEYLFAEVSVILLSYPVLVSLIVCAATFGLVLHSAVRNRLPTIAVPMTELESSKCSIPTRSKAKASLTMDLRHPGRPGFIQCFDPSTGEHLGEVKAMTPKEVQACVERASDAQKSWKNTSFEERRRVLCIMLKYIVRHQEEICRVASRDSGKPLVDALLGEVLTTCEKISYLCKHGENVLQPQSRPTSLMTLHKRAYVEYLPLGVIAAIAPWNYPFHNYFNHLVSGLFAGNAVVCKVSEHTCWSSRYFTEIARRSLEAAGHSPELVQTVTGFGEAGAALVGAGVDKVIFTGSPGVGRLVMAEASKTLTPVILELGGKDPCVICEDADLQGALPMVLRGVFQNCGQNCCGVERVVVYASIYERFLTEVLPIVKNLRQGSPLGQSLVDVGAMVTPQQLRIIQDLVDDAVKKGAKVLVGGSLGEDELTELGGSFYPPTILVNVNSSMRIMHEEVFGPVMTVLKVENDQELLQLVNDCQFGLGSSVFSANVNRARDLARQIRCGMSCVNDFATNYLVQSLPFGGVKESGFGRFAGPEGLRALCLTKAVVEDKVPFIKTTIPQILQYPIKENSLDFAVGLVAMMYENSLSAKLAAVRKLIGAALG